MKKLIMLAVVLTALVSCQSKADKQTEISSNDIVEYSEYEGVLPAADGPGIHYHLTMGTLTDGKGDYKLDMTYLDAKDNKDQTISSEGKVNTIENPSTKSNGEIVIQLTPSDHSEVIYFVVKNPKTLRLVNNKFEEPESSTNLNYDIVLVE